MPINDVDTIDTDLVSRVITDLIRGNAAGIDGLSAEHSLYCHPALSVVLAKLFQFMMTCSYVLAKSLQCDDFRVLRLVLSCQKCLNTVSWVGLRIIL